MKLSLSMLEWFLKDLHPISNIGNDSISIKGFRFLMEEDITSSEDYLYIGQTGEYFSDSRFSNDHFVINNMGSLIFHNCSFEKLMNHLLATFEYFNAWESRLMEAAGKHAPLQEIAELIHEVVGNQIIITGLDGKVLAGITTMEDDDEIWKYNIKNGYIHTAVEKNNLIVYNTNDPVTSLRQPTLVANVNHGYKPVMMMYVTLDQENVGMICIKQDDFTLTRMNQQLISYVNYYIVQAEEFQSVHSRRRSAVSIIKSLLDNQPVDPEVSAMAFQRFQGMWRLAVFKGTLRNDYYFNNMILRTIGQTDMETITLPYKDHIIAILPEIMKDDQHFGKYINLDLTSLKIGVSMACTQPEMLPYCLSQALYTLNHMKRPSGVSSCESLAFDYQLEMMLENPQILALVSPVFGTLSDYDLQKNTELRLTLETFMDCSFNHRMTAKVLHIHENTLQYRLKRIRELTDVDLGDLDNRRYLYLSNWLLQKQRQ